MWFDLDSGSVITFWFCLSLFVLVWFGFTNGFVKNCENGGLSVGLVYVGSGEVIPDNVESLVLFEFTLFDLF